MKTAELSGAALDWAVAKCDGIDFELDADTLVIDGSDYYCPSDDWAQGGAIIEREQITVECFYEENIWHGWTPAPEQPRDAHGYGETPLVAAMRCYVASKLGDEVEVPDELLSCTHE